MKLKKIILSILIISMLLLTSCKPVEKPETKDSIEVIFYVMSQCPFGLQVENNFKPVLEKFDDAIDFRLEFIGMKQEDKFLSLHGEPEINGNKAQLCAQKHAPDKFMEMIVCMNEDAKNIPDNWEECAEEMNKEKIKECYEGEEGDKLLEESFAKAQEVNAQGSPTMYFDGELYVGERDEDSFTRAICRKIDHTLCEGVPACKIDIECPATDGKIPKCENPGTDEAKCTQKEDAVVVMTILTSKNCADCDVSPIEKQLKPIMPKLEVKEVYIEDEEGKKLIEKYEIDKVPVVIFSKSIKETFVWGLQGEQMEPSFKEYEEVMMIKPKLINAHFFVDEEKRTAYFENLGIKTGDNKPQIDFFVMSYCPYGNIAEEAIAPVFELLEGKADFNPHYVIYSNYKGKEFCFDEEQKYCSMHGLPELNQGIRELCVAKDMGMKEYFDFAKAMNTKCDYKNADSCWEGVAEEIGLDAAKIKTCFENEALEILEKELSLNQAYGAKGSPQVFIDGNEFRGGRSPEDYKAVLCEAFEDAPEECSTELSSESQGPTGSC